MVYDKKETLFSDRKGSALWLHLFWKLKISVMLITQNPEKLLPFPMYPSRYFPENLQLW